jgi:hypothetical protein
MKIAVKKDGTSGRYDEQQVQVIYLGNKAVVKGYVPVKGDALFWLFPIVFGAIGAAFWIVLFWGIVKATGDFVIKQFGAEGTGIYLKHERRIVTDATSNTIYFTFENRRQEIIEAKTYCIFSDIEAERLKTMQTFPVKFLGNKAILTIDRKVLQNGTSPPLRDGSISFEEAWEAREH